MAAPVFAVTPLDGRHSGITARLSNYASEAALMRARVRVEIEYLLTIARLDAVGLFLTEHERETLRELYEGFDEDDADLVKRIEVEGHDGYAATNHDVKAIEYFIRYRLPSNLEFVSPWIHFGLTSEDVNNLAHRLLVRDAIDDVLISELAAIRDGLCECATEYRDVPMLGRTHGQPATPTTFGKEMAVFASRLERAVDRIEAAVNELSGKLSGATGTYGAHVAAYPDVDWRRFARDFVEDRNFEFVATTTQINPCDDLSALLDSIRGVNDVLLDLVVDYWLYSSDRYVIQEPVAGDIGSSTMPHKVNPTDFEIAEGNLSKANSDLGHLTGEITASRLQRDLSDSTAKRHMMTAMAYSLVGYDRITTGLETVVPNERLMREELEANAEVIGEAIQTILRREGYEDAYERVKALSRGRDVSIADFRELFDDLDVDETTRNQLKELSPSAYTGLSDTLAEDPS